MQLFSIGHLFSAQAYFQAAGQDDGLEYLGTRIRFILYQYIRLYISSYPKIIPRAVCPRQTAILGLWTIISKTGIYGSEGQPAYGS